MSDDRLLGLPYGIHFDVPEPVYHAPAFGVVSKSMLDQVARSPAHYKHRVDNPMDSTPALEFGRAFHCAALEPERFASEYVVTPEIIADEPAEPKPWNNRRAACKRWKDANTNALPVPPDMIADDWDCPPEPKPWAGNRAVCKAWNDAHPSALTRDDHARIVGMVNALHAHPLVSAMLEGGEPEVTVTWKDPETGLQCKSRADYYVKPRRMVVDLKTTGDASVDAFKMSIAKFRYHVQDALYRDAFAQAGEPIEHFVMVAVEKSAPHCIALYTLDAEGIAVGYTAARRDMEALADALRSDEWPGYPAHISTVDLPPWAS